MNTIMSAILSSSAYSSKSVVDKQQLLANLHNAVKSCQNKYGGRTELATESDNSIVILCHCFEAVLNHGLRQQPSSALKQMAELIAGPETPTFWNYVESQLTSHERERYTSLRLVWTDRGRARSLLRAAINERSLERYLHCWLGHSSLEQYYEEWAIMRDPEASAMLPNLAAGLISILFAITIDSLDLNSSKDLNLEILHRSEPIIAVPPPTIPKRKSGNHHVISFDDDDENAIISKTDPTSHPVEKVFSQPSKSSEIKLDSNNVEQEVINSEKVEIITSAKENESTSILTDELNHDKSQVVQVRYQNIPQHSTKENVSDQVSNLSDSGLGEGPFPLVESYTSSTISLKGSVDSTESNTFQTDIEILQLKLEEKEERCNWLEARVAELSRENQQLKQANNLVSGPSFTISIPKVHKIGSHYEYEILISSNHHNESWRLLRRYNIFYNLHKELCKKNPSLNKLDFPPKKAIGNMSNVVIEERRQRLQAYLRQLINLLPQLGCCTTRTQLERTLTFFRTEQEI